MDHRILDDAIPKSEATFTSRSGTIIKKRTTRGWKICVLWKDGSTNWVSLKDLKDSCSAELAEYTIRNDISDEPTFAWWVPYVIKKRTRIVSKLKSKYWQRTQKYGIQIPKNIDEAEAIGKMEIRIGWMPYN